MTQPEPTHSIRRLNQLIVALFVIMTFSGWGCGMDDMAQGEYGENAAAPFDDYSPIREAEAALIAHDIEEARRIYGEHLNHYPDHGAAAAGLAITDLLLVLGTTEATELLTENLGATRGLDVNAVIFAEDGYLYWASRGARWADDGQFQGIRTILADDLPWSTEQLASFRNFVEGLDEPIDKLVRKLVSLANALKGVDLNLETAIEDDNFSRLFIPGQVFHDSDLDLSIGRSELATLRAGIALFRSAVYFIAAYEHQWDLATAFGPWDVHLDDSHFVPGFEEYDYMVDYLDRHLFRRISSPERLSASRSSMRHALAMARDAIVFGLEEPSSTTMTWENIPEADAYRLDKFFAAAGHALDGPTMIPDRLPQTTLDFSVFFEEGRTLDPEIPWFVQSSPMTTNGSSPPDEDREYNWVLNEEAHHHFWIEAVIDPVPDDEPLSTILPGDEGLESVIDRLFGTYLDAVEDVYFTTR